MNIGIGNTQRKQKLSTALLRKKLAKLLRSLRLPDAEVSVLFVGDRAMRSLNRHYRHKDKTTDVLSFSFQEGDFSPITHDALGDIVISVPQAARNARTRGHSINREIDILLIHGLLHLLGYDHEAGEREARRMQRRELELLQKISA